MAGLPVREITVYKNGQMIEKRTEDFYRHNADELKGKSQDLAFLSVAGCCRE